MLLTHEAQSVSDWHNLSSMKDLYIPGEALLFCCLAGFIQLHCKISFPPLIPDLLSVTLCDVQLQFFFLSLLTAMIHTVWEILC